MEKIVLSEKVFNQKTGEDVSEVITNTEGLRNRNNNILASDINYNIFTKGKLNTFFYIPKLNFIDYMVSKN